MADGSIILDVDLNEAEAVARLKKIKSQILKLREDQAVNIELRSNAESKLSQITGLLDEAKAKLAQIQDAGVGGQALAEQQERVKMLQAEFDAAARAVDNFDSKIADGAAHIGVLQQEAAELGEIIKSHAASAQAGVVEVGVAADGAGAAAQQAGEDGADGARSFSEELDYLLERIKGLAKRVFFFSAITAGFRALKKYISAALQENEAFQKALAGIKGALVDAFAPIMTSIIPWIVALLNVLARAVTIISSLVGAVFGFSSGLKSTAKNLKDAGKAGGGAAKSFAAFDEINQLSDGGGGGGGGAGGDIMEFDLASKVSEYEEILGGALLVIGAILAFSGVNIPLGIALMAAGALTLASAAGVDWDKIKKFIIENRDTIQKIMSAAALVLGAILTFSGINIPLGIALMVAGAVGLAKAAGLNWGKIREFIKENIDKIIAIVSAAVLVLGVILTFAGPATIALGIALIVAGAVGLAHETALNWDAIKAKVEANKETIRTIAAVGSAALLVLGVILTVAGMLPLGIALIIAGAGGLIATSNVINWDAIKEKIVGIWESIKEWWNTDVAPIFTAAWWAAKFDSIKDGMKSAMNGVISTVESAVNFVVSKLNSISFTLPEWIPEVGGKQFGFNLSPISIPRLAQGAVIPPNREFLAMLGDQKSGVNIETPLETMVAAFRQALADGGAGRDITVVLELDGQSFGRAVYRANNDEMQRVGLRLVGG